VDPDNAIEHSLARVACLLRKRSGLVLRDVQVGSGEDDHRIAWNAAIQFVQSFSRGYAAGDWELCLRLLTRGNVSVDYTQSFAVIIEVTDTTGRANVVNDSADCAMQYAPITLHAAA
jgi:hypothetical protein